MSARICLGVVDRALVLPPQGCLSIDACADVRVNVKWYFGGFLPLDLVREGYDGIGGSECSLPPETVHGVNTCLCVLHFFNQECGWMKPCTILYNFTLLFDLGLEAR